MKRPAIELAFAMYNEVQELREATAEWGMVLYTSEGELRPGPVVRSNEQDRVQVYTLDDLLRVAGQDDTFHGEYLRDHHAHTHGMYWTSQMPSPADLGDVSVLHDLWPVANQDPLSVAPRLQLVQSLFCGDVFALEPVEGRPYFADLTDQQEVVSQVTLQYRIAFLWAENDHEEIELNATPDDFDAFVDAVLPKLNAALKGRATITFHPNEVGRALF